MTNRSSLPEFDHESLLVIDESTQYIRRKRIELEKPLPQRTFHQFSAIWESRGWLVERTRWSLQGETLMISAAWVVRAL